MKLVHQNPHLQTLYLEYCHEITENGLADAVKGSKVVNFSIKECPEVHGSFLEEMVDTRIFIMDHASRDIKEDVFRSFSKLNSLEYLNLCKTFPIQSETSTSMMLFWLVCVIQGIHYDRSISATPPSPNTSYLPSSSSPTWKPSALMKVACQCSQ